MKTIHTFARRAKLRGKTVRATVLATASATALATVFALTAAPAMAGSHGAHGGHGAHGQADAGDKISDFVDAEVRRVDGSRQRVTLRHAEIKALDMPPMTMVFAVSEPALLDQLKVGEKVQVRVAQRGSTYTVMEVRPAP